MKRRAFLKTLGLAGAAAATAAVPGLAAPTAANGADGKDQVLATLFDLSKCIGCGACVQACHEANAARYPEPEKPYPPMYPSRVKVEDWSDKRDVEDRLTPYNWLFIQSAAVTYQGRTLDVHMPRRCMHCQKPPCANLCPWGAAAKTENGSVRINTDICLGGAKCKTVCPWSIPQRQTGVGLYLDLLPSLAGNGVMYKCDRCYDRVRAGGVPACIEACPNEVQQIGPRDEIVKKAHELAASINGFIYGETENGGTNTIYVSPVPFELIEAASPPGPGRPTLKPVADAMSFESSLAAAVVVAPIAAVAGAVLRAGKRARDAEEKNNG
ncbi:4Fe-4S dicluster domain-containing protein [Desulfolutivibrio sulfoxidireducens]|uniref:4Fe-4S dicluster domain-containing protein n=1 Tax=Desulfolutivibrio sulfoxidireducens TaxID=2773299 RepID=UPI00159E6035|nr:4Fe-4S dicluster domain-containing protein [Desulfolutivibrio sulfoxidireducens]QLA14854.1 4Fe-4S dicluster domain-containing protein [Desulfolutivibrio sulfoxidireducens]